MHRRSLTTSKEGQEEFDLLWLGREVKKGILLKLDDSSEMDRFNPGDIQRQGIACNCDFSQPQCIKKCNLSREKKTFWRNSRLMNGRSKTKLGISRPGYLNVTSKQSASGLPWTWFLVEVQLHTCPPPSPSLSMPKKLKYKEMSISGQNWILYLWKLVVIYFHIIKKNLMTWLNKVSLKQIKLFKVWMYHVINKNFYLYQINIRYKDVLLLLVRINKQTVLMSSDVAFR